MRRIGALALVAWRHGMRLRLWILVPPAIVVLILADLYSPRFDPVFDGIPAAVSTSLLVMTVLAVVVGIFFATYAIPAEMESKVMYSVATKPVHAAEVVAGKILGMSLVLAVMLAAVGAGAYGYILVRASTIRGLAAERLAEARPRATYPADLNALQAVAESGPLKTYRYHEPAEGPAVTIDMGPDWRGPAGAQWILAETGMRFVWPLNDTPLREWTQSGKCRLRVSLLVNQAPEAKPAPATGESKPPEKPPEPQIMAGLLLPGSDFNREIVPGHEGAPVDQEVFTVPASGELEIPVAAPQAPPIRGILNLPASGDLVLKIVAAGSSGLVGARAGSVRIIGPQGQEHLVTAAPGVAPAEQRRRVLISGRSRLPREVAVFRFADVNPRWLDANDTAFEVGFSLDAWAAPDVQAEAKLTFIRPDGQQKALLFHPETHHSTVLYLDRGFWHGGPLDVRLESMTDDDNYGLLPESVQLRLGAGPYIWNFAKGITCVWLYGTILVAIGVFVSTRVSWFVGILTAGVIFLLSSLRPFLLHQTPAAIIAAYVWALAAVAIAAVLILRKRWTLWPRLGAAAGLLAMAAFFGFAATTVEKTFFQGWRIRPPTMMPDWVPWKFFVERIVVPLPDVTAFLPTDSLSMGQAMSLPDLGATFLFAGFGALVLVVASAILLKSREVAA
ncbi:MAG: ABC transporter permease [Planctomycetota bacterium]|nr:ABC transporter permease [Planctomycetota bacterium]